LYQDYERAFGAATGLPLSLAATEQGRPEACGARQPNLFFDWFARHHSTCASCADACQVVADDAAAGARTLQHFAGHCESSVPIRTGVKTLGFLRTGEVAVSHASAAKFQIIARHAREQGADFDEAELRPAFFSMPVMSPEKYHSILDLLAIFARHLSLVAGQLVLRDGNSEPLNIARARQFIHQHQAESLELKQVAGVVGMSSYYFCKKFKNSTGFTFTEYLTRARVEAAKNLLINPQVRVTEVAFEVGFQSISHFNRVFREVVGQCPSKYREDLPMNAAG
jgi:AraC-like DNA-binding protein